MAVSSRATNRHTRRQPGRETVVACLHLHEAGRPVDAAVAGELGHGRARLLRLAAMPAWKALLNDAPRESGK